MSSKSKRKGSGYELEIVRAHEALGIEAIKTPLSGALGGKYSGDVQVAGLIGECKRRRKGYSSLYNALEQGTGSDIMIARDAHRDARGYALGDMGGDPWLARMGEEIPGATGFRGWRLHPAN